MPSEKSKLKQLLAMVRQVMRDLPFEMSHALLGPNPRLLDHLAPARDLGPDVGLERLGGGLRDHAALSIGIRSQSCDSLSPSSGGAARSQRRSCGVRARFRLKS